MATTTSTTTLWAVSDLHAAVKANGARLDEIQPADPSDWLIVAGDVAEKLELVVDVMETLAARFDTVLWVPGNHELFSRSSDRYRGREKYDTLVKAMRQIGVITPEDTYPVFAGSPSPRCSRCTTTRSAAPTSRWRRRWRPPARRTS